jgi:cytochrome c oxidase subunit 3
MADAETQAYELPHQSWWPLAFGLGVVLLGLGLIVPGPTVWDPGLGELRIGPMLIVGFLAFAVSGLGWLREDVEWFDDRVGTGPRVGRWGVLLFIGSEIMIFGSLFATYYNFADTAAMWPPEGTPHLPIGTTGMFTIVLLLSGATMHWAHSALRIGNRSAFKGHMLLTLLLGGIFMVGQGMEYYHLVHEGLTLTTHPFGTTFYLLTGTHGLHVLAGLFVLGVVTWRAFVHDQFDAERHVLLEAAAIYWHFVDLVWVFVYAIVYLQWI